MNPKQTRFILVQPLKGNEAFNNSSHQNPLQKNAKLQFFSAFVRSSIINLFILPISYILTLKQNQVISQRKLEFQKTS